MKVANRSIFLLPKMSESEEAGRLTRIPGIVDAAAIMPVKLVGVPRLMAKGLSTGFFDIVELRIAKAPITHKTQKYRLLTILPACKIITVIF
jgi:hypothetical protein